MAEGVAAGLEPDGEAVGLFADGNGRHVAGRGVEGVDDVVLAAREPERLAVRAHIAPSRHPRPARAGVRIRSAPQSRARADPERWRQRAPPLVDLTAMMMEAVHRQHRDTR